MADMDYYGSDYGAEEPSRLSDALRSFGVVNLVGAVTSVTLAAVTAVWAVNLTFRDVSGVPVIRALEGPMRVEPENPGGTVAPFQGLALSDITSGGAAAPAPDQIVLAPAPVSLDAPSLAERRAALGEPPIAPQPTPTPDQIAADAAASLGHDGEGLAIADLTETLAQDAALPEPDAEALAPDASADTDLALAILPATVPGLARSSRPSQRPASLARRAAPPQTTPIEAPAAAPGTRVAGLVTAVDADPGTLLPGSRIVQVGAFDSEDAAMGEWDRLYARFRDYMDGKQRLVQKARSGGRDFWRLRVVGFDDGGDARRFCSALLAKDAPCIPVTVR